MVAAGHVQPHEGAHQRRLGPREVDLVRDAAGEAPLGALARALGPRPVNLLGALGGVGEDDDLVVAHLGEAAHQSEVALLAPEDKLTVSRARKIQRFLSQPFFVAEAFTGQPGRYVKLADTVKSFKEIVAGLHDDLPEQAFYMVGDIGEAMDKAKKLREGA